MRRNAGCIGAHYWPYCGFARRETLALDDAGCARALGSAPKRCLITGDRLETDVRMGQQAGMLAAVVLTGVTTREVAMQMPRPPDLIIENLAELIELDCVRTNLAEETLMLEMDVRNSGQVLVIGHRGAMGHAPENTLVSFAKGLELGSDLLELTFTSAATAN